MNQPAEYQASVLYLKAPFEIEWRRESLSEANLGEADLLCETLVTAISPGTELGAYSGLPPIALRGGLSPPARLLQCRAFARGGTKGVGRARWRSNFELHFTPQLLCIECRGILLVVPPGGVAEDLLCTYLFHLGYDAVLRSGAKPGSRVAVVGLGVLGLTSVALASVAGADVIGVTNYEKPRRVAIEYGATGAFSRQQTELARAALGDALADIVI